MQIQIKSVDIDWQGAGAKKWGKATVSYTQNGQDKKQTLVSFKNPDVFKKVQEFVNQTVEVDSKKNGEYWEWVSISASDAPAPSATGTGTPTSATRVSGSNYETKEERAARQVLIVKQSSLSSAVATLSPGAKSALDPKAVVETAQMYSDWIFNVDKSVAGMDDDIPF